MFSPEVLLQTPNSALVSGENEKSLALYFFHFPWYCSCIFVLPFLNVFSIFAAFSHFFSFLTIFQLNLECLHFQGYRRRRHASHLMMGLVQPILSVPHLTPTSSVTPTNMPPASEKPEQMEYSLLIDSKENSKED